MTRRSGGDHTREHGVPVTVGGERDDSLDVAAGLTLPPQAARARPIVHFAGFQRALQRLPIGVRHHQHSSAYSILSDDNDSPFLGIEAELLQIQSRIHGRSPIRISRVTAARLALVAMASPPKAVGRPRQSV